MEVNDVIFKQGCVVGEAVMERAGGFTPLGQAGLSDALWGWGAVWGAS